MRNRFACAALLIGLAGACTSLLGDDFVIQNGAAGAGGLGGSTASSGGSGGAGGTGGAGVPPGCGDGVHQPGELCLEQSTPLASGFRASRLAVARLDADVRFDLVALDSAGSIRAFLGKADGSMQTKAPIDRGVDGDRTDIVL